MQAIIQQRAARYISAPFVIVISVETLQRTDPNSLSNIQKQLLLSKVISWYRISNVYFHRMA